MLYYLVLLLIFFLLFYSFLTGLSFMFSLDTVVGAAVRPGPGSRLCL